MAVFTPEQSSTIGNASSKLTVLMSAVAEAGSLLARLGDMDRQELLNGNVDGNAVFADGLAQWAALKERMAAAYAELP